MVTIVDFVKRTNKEGQEFNALILQGGIELVKSQETQRWYATAKRASITSTFDDAVCRSIIGTQIPGCVQRIETKPYEFTVKETGEVLALTHRWIYLKEGEVMSEQVVAPEKVAQPL